MQGIMIREYDRVIWDTRSLDYSPFGALTF